ncbi:DNA-binding transcriptional regulator [Pedobacter sp. Leaf216]|uniref:helix-turn-helix transcriptional regulator n=1 Tax=Pedobacter sp. Leaf216 TaxID=1735684 RepID=UPI0006FE3A79|nr:YafY family protein [Pedobacter sp. Leaf216]KQM76575.1 DNA-binding transcriptional regulator [Pedobacter sp. Leaf216]
MKDADIKRISRLTAIITQMQSKRLLTASELADRFDVSVRTIYRDVKALEQAGIPINKEEGKGYSLMDGYRVPPIMFTENEASALITAEQILFKGSDTSLSREYQAAISKIKSVLQHLTKEKVTLLSDRIAISPAIFHDHQSNSLTMIQNALTSFNLLEITYRSNLKGELTQREIEPFALYFSLKESWLLIAFCRLRKDFRMFSLERIQKIKKLDSSFQPHKLTLAEYLEEKKKKFDTPDTLLS